VAHQRGQDRERVKVGDAFDPFAVTQSEPVDVGPFEQVASDIGAQPEFDEDHVSVSAPVVNIGTEAGEAVAEPLELCLCGLDPDRARCEWLHENHIRVQEFR
jgi:hypothetical protein